MSSPAHAPSRRALRRQVPLLILLCGIAVWLWMAPAHRVRNLRSASLSELALLAKAQPDDPMVLSRYGDRLFELGQFSTAGDVLLQAAERDTDTESLWIAAAQAGAEAHGDAAGIFLLTEYLKRHPTSARAHARLAQLFARSRAVLPAYDEACLAVKLNPQDAASCQLIGIEATLLHRLSDALKAMQRAVSLAPTDWRNQVGLGQTFGALGRTREAVSCYREAVRLAPDAGLPAYYLGKALLQEAVSPGEIEAAQQILRQSAKCEPKSADTWLQLGLSRMRLGRWQEALAPLERARALSPLETSVAETLARAYRQAGKSEQAAHETQRREQLLNYNSERRQRRASIGQMRGDRSVPLCALARFCSRHDDFASAALFYRQALAYSSKSGEAADGLKQAEMKVAHLPRPATSLSLEPLETPTSLLLKDAAALLAAEKYVEAQAAYSNIAAHDTKSAVACLGAAKAFEAEEQKAEEQKVEGQKTDWREAERRKEAASGWYVEAAKRDPHSVPALTAIAGRIFEVGMMEEAAARYRDILALEPMNPEAWHNLGVALRSQQAQWREGEAALRKAVALTPDNSDYWVDLAEMLWKRVQMKEAEVCYRRALTLKSHDLRAQSELGALLLDNSPSPGRRAEAEQLLKQVLSSLPHNDYVLFYLGKSALERNQPREAIPYLQQAAAHHSISDPLSVQYVLYRAYTRSGNTVKAKTVQIEADRLRRLNAAGKLAEDRLRDNSADPMLHLQLARLYVQNHQELRALEQYRKCLELAANNKPARSEMVALETKLRGEGLSEMMDKYYAVVALPLESKIAP